MRKQVRSGTPCTQNIFFLSPWAIRRSNTVVGLTALALGALTFSRTLHVHCILDLLLSAVLKETFHSAVFLNVKFPVLKSGESGLVVTISDMRSTADNSIYWGKTSYVHAGKVCAGCASKREVTETVKNTSWQVEGIPKVQKATRTLFK